MNPRHALRVELRNDLMQRTKRQDLLAKKDELEKDIFSGMSTKDLIDKYEVSRSLLYTVRRELGLVNLNPTQDFRSDGFKFCKTCKSKLSLDNFYSNGYNGKGKKYKPNCKSCEKDNKTNSHRENLLKALLKLDRPFQCELCGYNKNSAALHFHHIDPELKSFEIAAAKSRSLDSIVEEIKKCMLLCANCHAEIHHPGGVLVSTDS